LCDSVPNLVHQMQLEGHMVHGEEGIALWFFVGHEHEDVGVSYLELS
jgi:hypothetical protein